MQNHYNLLYREEEREMIPLCRAQGLGLIPWSPLARGPPARNLKAGTVRSKDGRLCHSASTPGTTESDDKVIALE